MSWKLLQIKKQIKSIKNTAKITKAMELVAASKMKNFQRKTLSIRDFVFDLLGILTNLSTLENNSVFLENRTSGKTAFVLYSSEKWLCWSLNQKLFKTLTQSKIWMDLDPDQRMVITLGKKAADFCNFSGIKIFQKIENIPENLDTYASAGFIESITNIWKNEDIRYMYMVAPHYKNSLVFYPLLKKFLPLSTDILESHLNVDMENIKQRNEWLKTDYNIIDSDKDEVCEELTMMISKLVFIHSFYELKASEYSSRMVAMKNATDSAKKMSKKKTLYLNKERQTIITQQISEIVAGSL